MTLSRERISIFNEIKFRSMSFPRSVTWQTLNLARFLRRNFLVSNITLLLYLFGSQFHARGCFGTHTIDKIPFTLTIRAWRHIYVYTKRSTRIDEAFAARRIILARERLALIESPRRGEDTKKSWAAEIVQRCVSLRGKSVTVLWQNRGVFRTRERESVCARRE